MTAREVGWYLLAWSVGVVGTLAFVRFVLAK